MIKVKQCDPQQTQTEGQIRQIPVVQEGQAIPIADDEVDIDFSDAPMNEAELNRRTAELFDKMADKLGWRGRHLTVFMRENAEAFAKRLRERADECERRAMSGTTSHEELGVAASEVWVVFSRVEDGDTGKLKPPKIERIFYDHDKAVEWVTDREMSIKPELFGDPDNHVLYTYHCDGTPVVSLPQYLIKNYKVS